MHNSFLRFVCGISKLHERKILLQGKVLEGLQSTAVAFKLIAALEKREKICTYIVRAFDIRSFAELNNPRELIRMFMLSVASN